MLHILKAEECNCITDVHLSCDYDDDENQQGCLKEIPIAAPKGIAARARIGPLWPLNKDGSQMGSNKKQLAPNMPK